MITFHKRSVLRWPGSKYCLLNSIIKFVPKRFKNYHEPFLGSGSVFLNINLPNKAYISDYNGSLINFYEQVKYNLPSLIKCLQTKENTEKFYYEERKRKYNTGLEKAAQLYYLNRTCFNGIYRVNSKGEFNVPFGKRCNLELVDIKGLKFLRSKLQNAELRTCDFEDTKNNIVTGDFLFLDPPYTSKMRTNGFLMYNESLFKWSDQLRLHNYCEYLIKKKAQIIVTNLFHSEIHQLFAKDLNMKTYEVERFSRVGSLLVSRAVIKEYVFTNV